MNKTRSILRLAISIALAFTLSCSSGDDNGGGNDDGGGGQGGSFNVNSQIYNEDGTPYKGSGYLDASAGIGDSDDNYYVWDHIRVGSVANGIVNLELDKAVPDDEYLEDFI